MLMVVEDPEASVFMSIRYHCPVTTAWAVAPVVVEPTFAMISWVAVRYRIVLGLPPARVNWMISESVEGRALK
jgi:hypothetical protein